MILIISNIHDEHIEFVTQILQEKEQKFIVLNTDDIPSKVRITLSPENGYITNGHNVLKCSDIVSVWYRKPMQIENRHTNKDVSVFVQREWYMFLNGLYVSLENVFWLNHPLCNQRSNSKIYQLLYAQKIGLQIPKTIMSNNQSDLLAFVSKYGDCIIKVIDQVKAEIGNDVRAMYTKSINIDQITSAVGIELSPVIIQQQVHKQYELRVIVVGKTVFACKIDSQQYENTKIDWRQGDATKLAHEQVYLDESLQLKLLQMMEHFHVQFAAFDLIYTVDGEYVFLEMNSNGQWAWIEKLTGMKIGEAIANLLITQQR